MPPQVCAKCRGFPAQEGDSWCTGCIGWEALGRELTANWDSEGGQHVANDLVVSTCRQVKALRSVTAGLSRSGPASHSAGKSRARAPERSSVPEPPAPPKSRERELDLREPVAKEEDQSDDDGEEESEEERITNLSGTEAEVTSNFARKGTTWHQVHRQREHYRRESDRRERSHRRSNRSRQRGRRRGGSNHKRLYRLAKNSNILLQRVPGRSFWELSTDQPGGGLDLARLGR